MVNTVKKEENNVAMNNGNITESSKESALIDRSGKGQNSGYLKW